MNIKKAWWFMVGRAESILTSKLVYLSQPFGLVISPEFSGIYFVSKSDPQSADETIYQFYTNF